MIDDFYDFEERELEAKGRDHIFLWSIFLLFLVALAFACWIGSFYIFGHPEKARPYKILSKLHKIEPPKRFEITAAPPGDFLSPQKLFDRYGKMSALQLDSENAELLRAYIKNYKETKLKVPYVSGRFEIIQARELQKTDMFQNGMVALAAAVDNPQIILEHIYPTAPENVEKLSKLLQPGLELKLERTFDIAALIHAARTTDGHLQFSVVPISYGAYAIKQGSGTFSLEPPADLNIAAGLPVTKGTAFQNAMIAFGELRRTKPLPESQDANKTQEPQLVRLDVVAPGTKVPETGALEPQAATPPPDERTAKNTTGTPGRNGAPKPVIESMPENDLRPSATNWKTYAAANSRPER